MHTQNQRGRTSYLVPASLELENVMASMRISVWIWRVLAAFTAFAISNGVAFASQGPGGGLGTASHLTQTAMAILVYGAAAIVVCAGLIGAARGKTR
jgi:hypothetical protein